MSQSFRQNQIIAFFKGWKNSGYPLDLALSDYFKSHKSLGSHDRRYIGDTVYTLIRWKSLFDHLDPEDCASQRLHLLDKRPIGEWTADQGMPEAARRGTSPFLLDKLTESYGPEKGRSLIDILNSSAPVSVRANLIKTTRDELLQKWDGAFQVRPGSRSATAIHFAKREPLFSLPEFKEGLFEVQDEGSQLVVGLVEAKKGDRILDYCCGSGGKTLAIAPAMEGKGELYLHDVRANALAQAKKRLRRAGVQNGQILEAGHPTLTKLYGKMDWVLIDVPCSGTGTLRRNPEMKWKIDAPLIERLIEEQRAIAAKAIRYLKPTGKLVYATCSILPEENEQQVEYFVKNFGLKLEKEPLQILPEMGGCDGFFAAVFRKETI